MLILIPLRPLLGLVLQRVGHGELLVLYGFLLALGGAEAFELAGLKGDLGALVLGVLIAGHDKADELAKTILTSFSEFGLIVAAVGVANGWIDSVWPRAVVITSPISTARPSSADHSPRVAGPPCSSVTSEPRTKTSSSCPSTPMNP